MRTQRIRFHSCKNIRIAHTELHTALSERIYDMMDGGKKIFPQEGIAETLPILRRIQTATVFSHDDVKEVYELEEVDQSLFPTLQAYENALNGFSINGK